MKNIVLSAIAFSFLFISTAHSESLDNIYIVTCAKKSGGGKHWSKWFYWESSKDKAWDKLLQRCDRSGGKLTWRCSLEGCGRN